MPAVVNLSTRAGVPDAGGGHLRALSAARRHRQRQCGGAGAAPGAGAATGGGGARPTGPGVMGTGGCHLGVGCDRRAGNGGA